MGVCAFGGVWLPSSLSRRSAIIVSGGMPCQRVRGRAVPWCASGQRVTVAKEANGLEQPGAIAAQEIADVVADVRMGGEAVVAGAEEQDKGLAQGFVIANAVHDGEIAFAGGVEVGDDDLGLRPAQVQQGAVDVRRMGKPGMREFPLEVLGQTGSVTLPAMQQVDAAAGSLEKRRCPASRVRQQRNKPWSAILRTVLLLTPSSSAICPVE